MKEALQDKLLYLPLHQFSFVTPLPKEKIYYQQAASIIPDQWFVEPTLLIIQTIEQYEKINNKETATNLIQDQNLRGIILYLANDMLLSDEVIDIFYQCLLPIVQLDNSADVSIFFNNTNEIDLNSRLSVDLIGFNKKGFLNISSELSQGLQTPFLFLDENNRLLWQTGQEDDLKIANQWFYAYRNFLANKRLSNNDQEVYDLFEKYPINITEDIKLTLVVFKNLCDWQKTMLNKFIGFTALVLQTDQIFQEERERFKEHFLYQLLYQKFESKKSMVMQGKAWGWNLEKSQHLLVIDVEQNNQSGNVLADVDEIAFYVQTNIEQIAENMIVFAFQDQMVVLVEDDEKERTMKERKDFILNISNTLLTFLRTAWNDLQFTIGIGKWYSDTNYLNKSYQEAKMALRFGQVWQRNQYTYHIYDLGLFHLLLNINKGILHDYIQEYISLLILSDKEAGTEYMKTIETYIDCQGVINDVSEALYVHPNTIRKRLKKIEDITGIDLQDVHEYMNLVVAIKMRSFIKS